MAVHYDVEACLKPLRTTMTLLGVFWRQDATTMVKVISGLHSGLGFLFVSASLAKTLYSFNDREPFCSWTAIKINMVVWFLQVLIAVGLLIAGAATTLKLFAREYGAYFNQYHAHDSTNATEMKQFLRRLVWTGVAVIVGGSIVQSMINIFILVVGEQLASSTTRRFVQFVLDPLPLAALSSPTKHLLYGILSLLFGVYSSGWFSALVFFVVIAATLRHEFKTLNRSLKQSISTGLRHHSQSPANHAAGGRSRSSDLNSNTIETNTTSWHNSPARWTASSANTWPQSI